MGRIKSAMIKKAASQLYSDVEGFNEGFANNKILLKGTIASKSSRNKVAGGIVRLARQKAMAQEKLKKKLERAERAEESQEEAY